MENEAAVGDASGDWETMVAAAAARWRPDGAERKQDRSRRREQDILQAAARVFARKGIARARIADVAAEAGIPVSSIYEYYASKEELAYAVPIAHVGQFSGEFVEKAGSTRTSRERLRLYLWLSADFARRNPDWARTLYLEVWPSVLVKEASVRKSLDDYARIIVHLIGEGERAGEWPPGPDPYETAAILIGSLNQLIITWLLYRRPQNIMKAAGTLIDRAMSVLDAPERPAEAARRRGPARGRTGTRSPASA
jgi:AcrR family transcriptional regulator